jgi:hypothetical protein
MMAAAMIDPQRKNELFIAPSFLVVISRFPVLRPLRFFYHSACPRVKA